MKKDIQLIWDFDDTIVKTNVEFEVTNTETAKIISKDLFGEIKDIEKIRQHQRMLDLEMVKKYGFTPQRYLLSWITTYQEIAKSVGKSPISSTIDQITETIKDLYIRKYENLPHSIDVLKQLKEECYSMIILTAGVEEVQKRKVAESGAIDYVDEIYVYAKKTPDTLKEIINKHEALDYVMIGNSLKSDIHPALENGIWGFHVERGTWEADHHDIDRYHEKYVHLTSITEIPEKLQPIVQNLKSLAI